MGLLDGKVAIITGAGGGLGEAYAKLFAKEGAKVVVNDLGGSRDGSGADRSAAQKVVDEIKAAGGEAVANGDDVSTLEGGENILKTALENYGQIDILVCNAGILRDKTFANTSEADWDLVVKVHLKGTYWQFRPGQLRGGQGRHLWPAARALHRGTQVRHSGHGPGARRVHPHDLRPARPPGQGARSHEPAGKHRARRALHGL